MFPNLKSQIMTKIILDILRSLSAVPRWGKNTFLLFADAMVILTAILLAFAVRFNPDQWTQEIHHFFDGVLWLCSFMMVSLSISGLYRPVLRHAGTEMMGQVLRGTLLGIGSFAVFDMFDDQALLPRSVLIASGTFSFLGLLSYRLMIRWVLRVHLVEGRNNAKQNVVIYGAGLAGLQLLASLRQNSMYQVVAFLDDDLNLQGRQIRGVWVHAPDQISILRKDHNIQRVLLALPAESHARRKEILETLRPLQIGIQVLPSLDQMIQGQAISSSLQDVTIEDLLGRDEIPSDPQLMDQEIRGKSVMVTGAGGSIGSELCREILKHEPRRLILFEISEFSLYRLQQDLSDQDVHRTVPVLGNIQDEERLSAVLTEHDVQTVFHAAAYKHVPLVEANPLEGLKNNVLGTKNLVEACQQSRVETCILISTDKAVRPTNVMGASKRIAELIVQNASRRDKSTKWSMVRFGNVLDSSGSVVPKFREQIQKRTAITVTHPEITRYFMSIGEAVRLVIQAGSMAQGGEVFLLEMGNAVKIRQLAVQMIELSGLVPDHDIPIRFTGLRPGEKLYEELLIDPETASPTKHPRIFCSNEPIPDQAFLQDHLQKLEEAIKSDDFEKTMEILKILVPEYSIPSRFVPQTPPISFPEKNFLN